ncbi:MAG: phage baseplate assembly protein [Deltaproteobacteria bacterium]|nr:phage baseplate assembly protein [Deltaproteobacteria bacterium]
MIRGIVKQVAEGLIKMFSASGRSNETFDDREYFQHYGLTSRPLPGAEVIIINEGNHYIAVASDDRRYRLALEEGEVALYTDEGDCVHLKRDKTIHIVSGNKVIADVANEMTVNCPLINLGGERGSIRYLIDERLLELFNNHVHAGVEPGGGSSGKPSGYLTLDNVCTTITKAG